MTEKQRQEAMAKYKRQSAVINKIMKYALGAILLISVVISPFVDDEPKTDKEIYMEEVQKGLDAIKGEENPFIRAKKLKEVYPDGDGYYDRD